MSHDLVIRNGTVYDGTGGSPVTADVGITGDTITTVGPIAEPGVREIDASGLAVTPGFLTFLLCCHPSPSDSLRLAV